MNTQNNNQETAKKVNSIIEQYKSKMPYYRIIEVKNKIILLEQIYTHQQIQIPENQYESWLKSDSTRAITNPYMLNDKIKYKNNPVFTISKDKDNEFKDIIVLKSSNNKIYPFGVSISKLFNEKIYCITNPMEMIEPVTYYIEHFEIDNLYNYIITQYLLTFSDYTVNIVQNDKENKILKFQISETDNVSEKTTIITLKLVDNKNITITGKRNNLKLNKTYSLRNRGINFEFVQRLFYKMYIDTCKELKLTPFRFITGYNYLRSQLDRNTTIFIYKINKNTFNRTKINTNKTSSITSATFDLGIFDCNTKNLLKTIKCKIEIKFNADINILSALFNDSFDEENMVTDLEKYMLSNAIIDINIKNNYTKEIKELCDYTAIARSLIGDIQEKFKQEYKK